MRRALWSWLINCVGLWAAALLVPGIRFNQNWLTLVIVSAIFGLVNTIVRPITVALSCPLMIVTLGLFMLVINSLMLWLASWLAGQFRLGFHVESFGSALLGSLVITAASVLANAIFREHRRRSAG